MWASIVTIKFDDGDTMVAELRANTEYGFGIKMVMHSGCEDLEEIG